jgi:hypothetical protein
MDLKTVASISCGRSPESIASVARQKIPGAGQGKINVQYFASVDREKLRGKMQKVFFARNIL